MQTGVADNGVRVKNSSPFSPSSASASLGVNSSISSVLEFSNDHVEEKPKINGVDEQIGRGKLSRSSIPVPSLISVTAATAEASSMNFAPSHRVGGAGEMINVEQVLRINQNIAFPAVAAVPVLQSQPDIGLEGMADIVLIPILPLPCLLKPDVLLPLFFFSGDLASWISITIVGFVRLGTSFGHGGSQLTPVIPGMNNSWGPQPGGSPYQFHCFPYNNMCFSSAASANLKRKVEVSRNPCDPPHMESFFGHMPSGFYQDSVFHTSFVPVQAVFPNPFLQTAVRGAPNYSLSAPLNLEAVNNQEMDNLTTSQGPLIGRPLGGTTSVPAHKRKVVRPSCSTSMSMTTVSVGNKDANLEPSDKHGLPPLRDHNVLEAAPIVRPALVATGLEPQPGYLTSPRSYRLEDDKEIEGKGWIVLVQKELRNTDVGNLGRIVLPKKDAEANLPPLFEKDGLILQMEDMTYSLNWKFKYRYWPNNRSRMYIARGKKGMNTLYAGEIVGPVHHGREEEVDSVAKDQLGQEQGTSVPTCSFAVSEVEVDAFAGEPFDFERDSVQSQLDSTSFTGS
ncbi:hypothetical protein HHK36_014517 [Tetracentron sinense]|uniref:TF-B3 domain-containing protein n=1 Tax=Tetracentron sinense TaxID=13715 RepID=A0A834Z8J7_TETSI|nr:hypothetical protein HHK36_014517 [Tetracentron sinense]